MRTIETRTRALLALLALLALCVSIPAAAADVCAIDPATHAVSVIHDEAGRGGLGGTGARVASATGSGGMGGTGAAAVSNGSGGLGGTGAALPSIAARGAEPGGIGGTGAPARPALAGTVLFAHGTVLALRSDGSSRPLATGAPVCEGDSIETRQASLAQLNMADGGQLDIRAASRLTLDRFVLPVKLDGSERFSATLAWGSIQATTGEIGHLHKAAYALHTPVSDIGIRGTVHEVFHVPNALPGLPAGTYNRVLSGGTTLGSAGQRLELAPNETGFVAGLDQPPRRLSHFPPALAQMAATTTTTVNVTLATSQTVEPVLYVKPLQAISDTFDLSTIAPEGSAYVGVSQDIGNAILYTGGVISRKRNGSVIVMDPDWGIPIAAADTHNGFNFMSRDTSPLYDLGYATVDGVDVIWGLYGTTQAVDPASGASKDYDFHHFAYAEQGATPRAVLAAMSGTATFGQLVGGTMLTDEGGGIGGQVNSLSIGVRFGPNAGVTSYQLDATDSQSRNWQANFNGSVSLSAFRAGQLPLVVQCLGDGCGSGAGSGSAAGIVIGNSGKGVITSYGLKTTTGQSAAGAAVVARP
jgi:hypothetical protein